MKRLALHSRWRLVAIALGALMGGCGGGSSVPSGGAGTSATGGAAGLAGVGGSAGIAGVGGNGGTGTGGDGSTGTAVAGAAGAAGSSTGGAGADVDSSTGTTGDPEAGASIDGAGGAAASRDAGGSAPDATGSNKVLVYGVTTGFRHASIPAAANAIAKAAAAAGLTTEQVGCTDATNVADPTKFTAAALAQYGAVVLLANSGEPIGYPATQEIQNLIDFVQHGGALVAIEDASHCYDGQFNGHPASQPYIQLIGGDFVGHPGDVSPARCTTVGTQSSVVQLPAMFGTTDEVYAFSQLRTDNQVVLRCVSGGDSTHTVRPVSWAREEGAGRYFYTALGHLDASWTAPMDPVAPNSRLVEDHVIPALLWTMRR